MGENPIVLKEFSYLEGLTARGMRADLSVIKKTLEIIGNPESRFPVILVGGTNGKGSVVTFLGSVLARGGYRTGLYFSPHINDVRERIAINGRIISRSDGARLIGRLRSEIEKSLEPTYFEFLTALAFFFFEEQRVDFAVMEVGMGGRFDATNVVKPALSIISSISLDHIEYLGDTEEKICLEKAEILHDGGTLVVGKVKEDTKDTLKKIIAAKGATGYFYGEDFDCVSKGGGSFEYRKFWRGAWQKALKCRTKLWGRHQGENAVVALMASECLKKQGYKISGESMSDGIWRASIHGRLEVVGKHPEVIFDVGHNPAAALSIAAHLESLSKKKTVFVVGMMADKDISGFLEILAGHGETFFLASPAIARAASKEVLMTAARGLKAGICVCDSVDEALASAIEVVGREGRVMVTGSFYTVSEAAMAMKKKLT